MMQGPSNAFGSDRDKSTDYTETITVINLYPKADI